ncbi:MAG: hypothetical protein AAF950_17725 [Pseudomonadota bacterium]
MAGSCAGCGNDWEGDHAWVCPNCGSNQIHVEGESEQWGQPFPLLTSDDEIESNREGENSLFNEKERAYWEDVMI